jgi:hypothetical protein
MCIFLFNTYTEKLLNFVCNCRLQRNYHGHWATVVITSQVASSIGTQLVEERSSKHVIFLLSGLPL